ncbi:hypothetical protein EUA49_10590 [Staphylococcus saprophyticus]|uniref:hypothetical protein n=1 Tax=Staphylococcus saprophyticus TaxID=29385 RepID=UPI001013D0E7|nr:hypothetical protein [Staphylococcus saprophyticus]RXS01987.1 hypothetical protein EUA49_10590 [Staphylococcus saprophyticus]
MNSKSINNELNIIIGLDSYNDEKDVFLTNEINSNSNSYCFYKNFNTVAFVIKSKTPFKHSFENILNLIYFKQKTNIRKKYMDILQDPQAFIEEMYQKNIVFVNQDEITNRNKKLLLHCNSILMCGNSARERVNNIINQSNTKNNKTFHAIHPSTFNIDDIRYIDDWVDIKTRNNYETYQHKVKKHFMI